MSTTPFEVRSRGAVTEEAVAVDEIRATCLHRLAEVDVVETIVHFFV